MITIAGVQITERAAARLARILYRADQHALSAMIGRAIDHRDDRVDLWERDYPVILAALQHDPAETELDELVSALEKRLAREPDGL